MGLQIDLHEVINERYLSFADSPSAFLGEVEKLTTYADCLTQYGVNKLEGIAYPVSFIVKLVLGFTVFAGIISQLGFCLLNLHEIGSVFRLLPVGEGHSKEPMQIKYFVILIAIWVGLSGVFFALNVAAEKLRQTSEYTLVDEWIDDTSGWVILAAEQDIEVIKKDIEIVDSAHSFTENFAQKRNEFISEQEPALIDAVNSYFDSCEININSYAEWYESPPVIAERFLPVIGENIMRDEFDKQVIDPVSADDLNEQYRTFLDGLRSLYEEYWNAEEIIGIAQQAPIASAEEIVSSLPNELNLWPSWDSEDGKKAIQETLLGKGDNMSSDVRERIKNYIQDRRSFVVSFVESLPDRFKLTVRS